MQGVADPAPEDRSESDEVPAKLRKCSGKRLGEWKFLEDIGGTRELGGSASGFDGFEEIMESYLLRGRTISPCIQRGAWWKVRCLSIE